MNDSRPSVPYSHTSATASHTTSTATATPHAAPQHAAAVAPAADSGAPSQAIATVRLDLSPINYDLPAEQRADEVIRLAEEAFPKTGKWVLFYREILGADGVARKLFPTAAAMREFEQTPQFEQLLEMTAAMRAQDTGKGDELEPQKMITVRLPKSQHEAMKVEAKEHGTSINKLCISKLLLPIKAEFIPKEKGKVRGRKPGPQGTGNRLVDTSLSGS